MEIKTIGVVGAGQMGNGIAHVCALAGYNVKLTDVSLEKIESGLATINGNMARQVKSDRISDAERDAALARIKIAEDMAAFEDVDLAIETAAEDEAVKRQIFDDLCKVLRPEALLGSNTSSLSITRLAAATDRPEQFIGIHFMNPVPVMERV